MDWKHQGGLGTPRVDWEHMGWIRNTWGDMGIASLEGDHLETGGGGLGTLEMDWENLWWSWNTWGDLVILGVDWEHLGGLGIPVIHGVS